MLKRVFKALCGLINWPFQNLGVQITGLTVKAAEALFYVCE